MGQLKRTSHGLGYNTPKKKINYTIQRVVIVACEFTCRYLHQKRKAIIQNTQTKREIFINKAENSTSKNPVTSSAKYFISYNTHLYRALHFLQRPQTDYQHAIVQNLPGRSEQSQSLVPNRFMRFIFHAQLGQGSVYRVAVHKIQIHKIMASPKRIEKNPYHNPKRYATKTQASSCASLRTNASP